jgi:type IV pilus assembly protein PilC
MFAPRISTKQLALLSRSLGVSLQAGVPVVKAIDTSGRKSSDGRLRRVLQEIVDDIKSGSTFTEAIDAHGVYFPDLFVDMASVAEQTGSLPEVLLSLSEHYENNLRLRKDFISQILWPVIQLVAAILVIAMLIYVLGWISDRGGTEGVDIDILGWGLLGAKGATLWLLGWVAAVIVGWFGYKVVTTSLAGRQLVHRTLLQIPVVGTCLRNFGIARFSWALHLTQSAGMPIDDSLDASLRATANGAFDAAAPDVNRDILQGETLSDALNNTRLFPEEFINIVHVSETSGTVPEALHRLSPQFEEDARRSLKTLTMVAAWLVWLTVAGFIVYVIFKIVLWYTGLLNSFRQNPLG